MSDSSLTSIATRNAALLGDLTRQERPAASLTLTRTATQVLSAGLAFPWQTQIRGQGITWSGTTITIPTAGYYHWSLQFAFSVATMLQCELTINGTLEVQLMASNATAVLFFTAMTTRYFSTGDTVIIRTYNSTGTVLVNAETAFGASPLLHVVQLTGVVT